jgi:tripartite-type tricarboxylate transporter receptor subunit TctC
MKRLLAGLLAACALTAHAQYPTKPVQVIISFTPASATDIVGRIVTAKLAEYWGQPVVNENRAGAGGAIGSAVVAKAAPDGYTLLINSNAHSVNPAIYAKLPYDTTKDFTDIAPLSELANVLVVSAESRYKTLADLVGFAKANPGKLNFGAGNTGGLANAWLFMSTGGFSATEVSYKSPPAAVVDLLGGRIDFMSVDYFIVADHFRAGTLRPIGVTSKTRLKALPNVPPIADTLPGYELNGWTASFAAAGTPPELIARLNKAFTTVLTSPEVDEYFEKQGMQTFATTPEALGAFVKDQVGKWADVLSKAGVQRQ